MISTQGYAYGEGVEDEELHEERFTSRPNSSDEDFVSSKRHKTEISAHPEPESSKQPRSFPSSRDQHYRNEGWGSRGRGFNNGNFPPNINFGMHPPMMGNMMGMMFNPAAMGMGMYGMGGQGFDYMPPPNFNHGPPPPYRNEGIQSHPIE